MIRLRKTLGSTVQGQSRWSESSTHLRALDRLRRQGASLQLWFLGSRFLCRTLRSAAAGLKPGRRLGRLAGLFSFGPHSNAGVETSPMRVVP